MDTNYSLADIAAINKDEGLFGNSGSWLIILLLFWGFMGNGFGTNNNQTISDYATQEQLFNVQKDVLTTNAATNAAVAESKYDTLLGFKDAQYQQSQCCCDIKSAILQDGALTRQMITDNRIANLQDQLDTARAAVANATQTQNILSALGRYYTNPSVNPYYAYNTGNTVL